jgi:16S rRNA (guanine966-N2)-methyltransferase
MLAPVSKARPQRKLSAPPGQVRIIGGEWRGRKLPVPDVEGLRPTPDRVRETVFNWLMPVIEGSGCLDLFAGSGAFGLEAASRGASQVWLVERDATASTVLRENIDRLGTADRVRLFTDDALALLRRPATAKFAPVVELLRVGGWLAPQALIYTEWPADQASPLPGTAYRASRAGNIAYALYRPDESPR